MMNKQSFGRFKSFAALAAVATILTLAVRPGLSAGADSDLSAVVKDNNAFAFDLYSRLKTKPGNIIFSPYNISSALAMTYAGAKGETARQMAQALHFTLGQDRLHPALAQLTKDLNARGGSGKYELVVANRLWGAKGETFLPAFLDLNKKFYGAGFEVVDFAADPEKARGIINKWADELTRGKIKDPVPPGGISADMKLVLANAIYFKGKWLTQFKKADTKDTPFFLSPDKQVKVPMMYQRARFNWGETGDLQFLEMPYLGNELSMLVLLPVNKDGLAGLESKLSPEFINGLIASGQSEEVFVYLPRFKLEFGAELSELLPKMGMTNAFSGAADFSGMTGQRDILLSKVLHKAMVDVNEEGTEAAAVTVVTMPPAASAPKISIFRADHPFLFLFRDNKTGSILFLGRVLDPRG